MAPLARGALLVPEFVFICTFNDFFNNQIPFLAFFDQYSPSPNVLVSHPCNAKVLIEQSLYDGWLLSD